MSSKGHFAAYKSTLEALSARTGTPLPSLLVSFGVLHEITAVVPLIGVFYGARTLGIGEHVVTAIIQPSTSSIYPGDGWLRETLRTWVEEGDRWAARVGKRYGVFGFEKRQPGAADVESSQRSTRISGDVANAVVAYGVTKALIPLRIGVSLYLSPAFSRRIVEPLRRTIIRSFRREH